MTNRSRSQMEELIRMTPNPERAKNILQQVKLRLKDASNKDPAEFATLILEAHYEVIKELTTALLAIDGYKTLSHLALIQYLREKYPTDFTEQEIRSIDDLRKIRNRIAYEGFMITEDIFSRKEPITKRIISRLQVVVEKKLTA